MDNRAEDNSVSLFAKVTEDYCRTIEQLDTCGSEEFAWRISQLLCLLYQRVSQLPPGVPASEEVPHDDTVVYAEVASRIEAKLGAKATYWEVFDPYEPTPADMGSLGDDLADIYRDLKNGLSAYHKGTGNDVADAVFQWKESFTNHWGRHLVGALRPLWEVSRYYSPEPGG